MTIFCMNLDLKLMIQFNIGDNIFGSGGNLRGGINREGITYYNNLINELLSNGLNQILILHAYVPKSNIFSLLRRKYLSIL